MIGIFGKLGHIVAAPITLPVKAINGKITDYAKSVITGQVGRCIAIGAGWLTAHGVLQQSDEEKFTGAAIAIATLLMSWGEKKLLKQGGDLQGVDHAGS